MPILSRFASFLWARFNVVLVAHLLLFLTAMRHTYRSALALLLFGLAASCGSTNEGTPVVVENEGRLCVVPRSAPVRPTRFADTTSTFNYAAGSPLDIVVVFDGCLSSSCDGRREASCTLTETSSRSFRMTSLLQWTDFRGDGLDCTDDCGFLEARCTTSTLAAGQYSVELDGAQTVEFEVGSITIGDEYCSP